MPSEVFVAGVLLGILAGLPTFAAAKYAGGVLSAVGGGCLGYAALNGPHAFWNALAELLNTAASNFAVSTGFLSGLALMGLAIAILRGHRNWWD